MICDKVREGRQRVFGRVPKQRTHREIVVLPLTNSKLVFEILEGVEGVRGIELFIILAVTALHFSVVARCVWLNQFVPNAELFTGLFKERLTRGLVGVEAIRKLRTVVCLNALDQIRKLLKAMSEKNRRRISAVLLKCF